MKKLFLSLLLTASISFVSHAQGTKVGVRAGVNLANYAGALSGLQYLVGFHGGPTLNVPLSQDGSFALQPELLYSQRGNRFEGSFGNKASTRNHYVDLPLLARLNMQGLIFEAGPQLGYLVGINSRIEFAGGATESNNLDGLNRFDVGYVAGVGYQLSSGPSLTVRYNGGLSDLSEGQNDGKKVRNSVFQFSLGYVFSGK